MKFLLHKKCDTHAVNNWGKTGLDYAMEQHHDHVVRVLEMQGAPRGEVRAKTPPKVVERELGRVAERRHWVQQLLNRHAADRYVDTPCQHEGVVAEVLQANRNRGFVADNHYDIRASMQALAAATSSPAFCLPELLPSVILWRALTHCVTHPSSDASTAGLQDTDGGIPHTASKQQAETIDQEWRKVSVLRTIANCCLGVSSRLFAALSVLRRLLCGPTGAGSWFIFHVKAFPGGGWNVGILAKS